MHIGTLSNLTGISKRNIHFYINEGLLSPETDEKNGYYNFTENDVRRLNIIKQLREADLSISMIRSLFSAPASSEYYLRMQLNLLRRQREKINSTENVIENILNDIPAEPTIDDIYTLLKKHPIIEKTSSSLEYDGRLVNHFLWHFYLPKEEMTEYQFFLWERLNKMTDTREKNPDYSSIYDSLCSMTPERIESLYNTRNTHYSLIAEMNEKELDEYARNIFSNIKGFIASPAIISKWKSIMNEFHGAMMRIYTSEISIIGEEMCPFFKKYRDKAKKACKIVYNILKEDKNISLLNDFRNAVGGDTYIEHYDHAIFESVSFIYNEQRSENS